MKQKKFATVICCYCKIDLPDENSVKAYSKFISDNIEAYREARRQSRVFWSRVRQEQRMQSRSQTKFQNTFGGAYNSDIVDCYDYGISPYGNS